jgi:hypothetical protein
MSRSPCGTIAGITREVAGCHDPALATDLGLGLARDDIEDLLPAVSVPGEVLAGPDLEVDDGTAVGSGRLVEREVDVHHRAVGIAVEPAIHKVQRCGLGGEHSVSSLE